MAKKKIQKIEKKSGNTGLIITVVGVCMVVFIFLAARKGSHNWEVPGYLVGRWVSSAPAYQDRYLDISRVSLLFATGPTTVSEYFISNLTPATATANETSFTIDSKDNDGITYQFFLTYQPVEGGTLFFKNQPDVKWHKSPS